MALSLYQLEPLVRESITTFNNLKSLDFKALTLKDIVTLVGLVYTAGKGLAMGWQLWKAVQQHGLSKVMRPNLKKKYGAWAVVTGCSKGIGTAYVMELAKCCLNIVLVSRPYPKLLEFAEKIEKDCKVQVCVVEVDISDYECIFEKIREQLEGKEIGILVNNVGVGRETPEYFLDVPSQDLLSMINVNIVATTLMTQMILPQMIEREKGAIVVIASGASDIPAAELAVYGATKSYLDYFTECLRLEYSESGVTIQLLKPYFIADGKVENVIPGGSFLAPTPEKYARGAVSTLGWSDNSTGYWVHTIQSWVRGLLPRRGRQILSGWINELLRQANKDADKPPSNLDGASFYAIFG